MKSRFFQKCRPNPTAPLFAFTGLLMYLMLPARFPSQAAATPAAFVSNNIVLAENCPVPTDADFSFSISSSSPTARQLTLTFKNAAAGDTRLTVHSYIGREVFAQTISISAAGDASTTVSLPGTLPAGTYLLKAESSHNACTKMFQLRAGA